MVFFLVIVVVRLTFSFVERWRIKQILGLDVTAGDSHGLRHALGRNCHLQSFNEN